MEDFALSATPVTLSMPTFDTQLNFFLAISRLYFGCVSNMNSDGFAANTRVLRKKGVRYSVHFSVRFISATGYLMRRDF